MSSAVRSVAARSGVRVGAAAVKSTGAAGLIAASASQAGARTSYVGIAASCRVSQLAFSRTFVSTADDKAVAAEGTKKAAPKKTAATKKTGAKKKIVKKAKATKKKVVKKAKKAKKVTKPKKVVKVLTEEEKAKKAVYAQRKAISALRTAALIKELPATAPGTSWALFNSDHKAISDFSLPAASPATLGPRSLELARRFRALSDHEREDLSKRAAENQVKNAETYREWVEKFTPEEIQAANKARRALVKLAKEKKAVAMPLKKRRAIEDHRVPKKPLNRYAAFTREQWATGEYGSSDVATTSVQISAKWKALSPEEREQYRTKPTA